LPWRNNEILSGTIYFKNTDKTKKLIERWITLNSQNISWDQINFKKTIESSTDLNLNINILPHEYCYIFDNIKQKALLKESPYIVHNQASRRYKKIINNKR
jgi:hypothetical protein